MGEHLEIAVDGACSGNPGRAGIGVVIKQNGAVVKEIARPIGEATNNIAEYSALICALQEAVVMKAKTIKIFTDSELVYKQVLGEYKIKNETLKGLWEQVKQLEAAFESVELIHVLREKNQEADRLATSSLK